MAKYEDIVGINIIGDKALEKELRELYQGVRLSIMRSAINAGLTPILKRAISLAKSNFKSDTIAKHIKKSAKNKNKKKGVVGKVFVEEQPERKIKLEGREVPFEVVSNILEFGRKDGSLPARSFMRRAREEMKSEALKVVREKTKSVLEKKWRQGKIKFK